MIKFIEKNRRLFKAAIAAIISILVMLLLSIPKKLSQSDLHPIITKEKIAILTDIHAASQDVRKMDNNPENIVYPNKYATILPEKFKKMKAEGINFAIVLGDNTNNSSDTHAEKLKKITEDENMQVMWLKGNHEKNGSNVMEILGVKENYYYYIDRNNWRIVALNTVDRDFKKGTEGDISEEQLDWLDNALNTDRFVLIAMHHPIWNRSNLETLSSEYIEFEKILAKHRNIRYIFSGHWHTESWIKEKNGIKYYQMPAFLLDGNIGYYKIMELESYTY